MSEETQIFGGAEHLELGFEGTMAIKYRAAVVSLSCLAQTRHHLGETHAEHGKHGWSSLQQDTVRPTHCVLPCPEPSCRHERHWNRGRGRAPPTEGRQQPPKPLGARGWDLGVSDVATEPRGTRSWTALLCARERNTSRHGTSGPKRGCKTVFLARRRCTSTSLLLDNPN